MTNSELWKLRPGTVVVLGAKSLKGKNRLREHGDRWLVREADRSVLGKNLGLLVCPAAYIGTDNLWRPTDPRPGVTPPDRIGQNEGYCRWVRRTNDPHFEVISVDPTSATADFGGVQQHPSAAVPDTQKGSDGVILESSKAVRSGGAS